MHIPTSGITACLLSAALILPFGADAQTSRVVDQLIAGSSSVVPLRPIDPSTRASKRYAIVIGNATYTSIPTLPNAIADADVMAEFFASQGYLVHHHTDISKRGFEDVLRRVLFDVDKDTEVVVFFAGHGFQIGSENYLVPVDADLDTIYDVPFEAVSLGSLVGIIGARARLQVVILDSCRDNPFAGRQALTQLGTDLREARTGFSSQAAPLNSMLIFSTSPGALAYDGVGANSPFTASLVQEVNAAPDALVKDVFEGVRRLVYQRTDGRQVPWDSSTLVEPASFGIGAALMRPIAASSEGTGQSRGLVRIIRALGEDGDAAVTPANAPLPSLDLDADFVPEVDIGGPLTEALAMGPGDRLAILDRPRTGRLMLIGEDGQRRDVTGETLDAGDAARLVLTNESVQIPALSLESGKISDSLRVAVNGDERQVNLNLTPEACDFHAGDHLDPDGMGLTRYPNEIEPDAALAACTAAVAANPDVGRYHYQLGRAHLALLQHNEAEAAFTRARDLGHTRAWQALGNAILNRALETGGLSRREAPEEVLQLFARGVDEGDPYAFYALGRQLMLYGEDPGTEIEGYDLLMRSLEVGHTFAMNAMAQYYLDEDGEFYDGERGLRYLTESAARGDIYGINALGIAHWRGRGGLTPDPQKALAMFIEAADGGHPTAPYNIARMYRDGDAGTVDTARAVAEFGRALDRGMALAGLRAAEQIQATGAAGYDMADAAVFAAKTAALRNQRGTQEAREMVDRLPPEVLSMGAQRLLNQLGATLVADGDFGPSSQAAQADILARLDGGAAQSDPGARIVQLARMVWRQSPFRVDLY